MQLLPPSIEEYVGPDDTVRAYNAFVDSLSLDELGIIWDEHKVGNSEYDPKAMIKLIVYGCSYGFRSSRKLEKATYHNLSFIWLVGGLKPDHKTMARFRKNNRNALKNILKRCIRLCIKLDLIEGNTLFVDGTRIRANASIHNTWTPARLILNTCRKTAVVSQRLTDTPRECGTTFGSQYICQKNLINTPKKCTTFCQIKKSNPYFMRVPDHSPHSNCLKWAKGGVGKKRLGGCIHAGIVA